MRILRIAVTALLAGMSAAWFFGTAQATIIGIAVYLALAALLGEYILPFLSHLSAELFDLHERVNGVLPSLYRRENGPNVDSVRVYVLDDDAPMMTWLGFRTLMVSRGCYNLQAGEFRCALQEAYEQRCELRSFVLLLATVGNVIFLGCRIFCRCGRFVLRMIGMLLGAIVSVHHMFRAGQVGAAIGDGLYRAFSALFLAAGNLSVYIPYWLTLVWADADVDRALCAHGMRGSLLRLIEQFRRAPYTGRYIREYALILRMPSAWRVRRAQRSDEAPAGILNIPSPRRTPRPRQRPNGGDTIEVVRVTRRNG